MCFTLSSVLSESFEISHHYPYRKALFHVLLLLLLQYLRLMPMPICFDISVIKIIILEISSPAALFDSSIQQF